MSNSVEEKPWIKRENVILAVLPVFGSLVALAFEAGYLSYFDVPAEYIELGFIRVFVSTAVIAFPVTMLWAYIGSMIDFGRAEHPFLKVISNAMLYTFFIIVIVIIGHRYEYDYLIPVVFFIAVVLMYLVPEAFNRKKGVPYWERVKQSLAEESSLSEGGKSAGREFKDIVIMPATCAFFGLLFCFSIGRYYAGLTGARWVMTDRPEMIFVRKYGDYIIFKAYDPKTRTLLSNVEILKMGLDKPLKLKLVMLGQLSSSYMANESPPLLIKPN
ncbi:hypothetical protein FK216_09770 [Moraxellaceae bacterium AER2_44_116]|nr:hypothetical protein [Moraxellaceae bacterium]TQC97174.1 hypothetical protein FK216_09770 [Moraxellaceae bacterium AER2_44_116]